MPAVNRSLKVSSLVGLDRVKLTLHTSVDAQTARVSSVFTTSLLLALLLVYVEEKGVYRARGCLHAAAHTHTHLGCE